MLNELLEIQDILDGKRIDKKNTYRTTLLLGRYYLLNGDDVVQARQKIFDWANKYRINIPQNLTRMLAAVWHKGTMPIRKDVKIYISPDDVREINSRFSKKNERLLAFAFLTYAKMNADEHGLFEMSMVGLSNWTGISKNNIYARYMQSLFDMKYIEKFESGDESIALLKDMKSNKITSKNSVFKILVPFSNKRKKGSKTFKDENIREEFKSIVL